MSHFTRSSRSSASSDDHVKKNQKLKDTLSPMGRSSLSAQGNSNEGTAVVMDEYHQSNSQFQERKSSVGGEELLAEEKTQVDFFFDRIAKWVIIPSSPKAKYWELIIVVLLIYTLLVLPVRVAFETEAAAAKLLTLDIIVDVLFGLDMVLNFFTGYELDSGFIETSHKLIWWRYLKGWFVLDLLAILPWGNLGASSVGQAAKAPRMFKLARLIKVCRAYRFQELIDSLYYNSPAPASVIRIISLFFVSMTSAHISACLWYFFATLDTEGNSWINGRLGNQKIDEMSDFELYMVSFYWALTTLTTVGYGDVTPLNMAEIGWAITNMLLGTTFFAYMAGSVTSIVTASDVKKQEYRHYMSSLRKFMVTARLPRELQARLSKQLSDRWKDEFRQFVTWDEMRSWVDEDLQWKIIREAYGELILQSDVFTEIRSELGKNRQDTFQSFVVELASSFRGQEYMVKEQIAEKDEKVRFWSIIRTGSVALQLPSSNSAGSESAKPLASIVLRKGWTFGECALFIDPKWRVSVQAMEQCSVYQVLITRLEELLLNPANRPIYKSMKMTATKKYAVLRDVTNNPGVKGKENVTQKDSDSVIPWDADDDDNAHIEKMLQTRYDNIDKRLQDQAETLNLKLQQQFDGLSSRLLSFEERMIAQEDTIDQQTPENNIVAVEGNLMSSTQVTKDNPEILQQI